MPSKKESSVFHEVIHVDEIEKVELGGSEAVQITDVVGNEFTTFMPEAMEMLLSDRDDLVGETVEIGFTVYKGRYLSYHSIGSPDIELDEDPVDSKLDPESLVEREMTETDRRITRQSAVHDASRIVQGMLASDNIVPEQDNMECLRDDVQDELEYWTEKFKDHHRTGEWKGDDE